MDATTNQLHYTAATDKIKSTIQNMKTSIRRIAQIYAPDTLCLGLCLCLSQCKRSGFAEVCGCERNKGHFWNEFTPTALDKLRAKYQSRVLGRAKRLKHTQFLRCPHFAF